VPGARGDLDHRRSAAGARVGALAEYAAAEDGGDLRLLLTRRLRRCLGAVGGSRRRPRSRPVAQGLGWTAWCILRRKAHAGRHFSGDSYGHTRAVRHR
jgi:hypothetical protein